MKQIELVRQLKNADGVNNDGTQSMFILTILEKKNQRSEIKIFSRKCKVLTKDDKLSRRGC